MKIAVLNECFLKENHIQKLRALGEVLEYKDTTTEDLAIQRLQGIDIALVDGILFPATKNVLESTTNLKLLVVNTTGYDSVDLETANKKGIKVANVATYATEAVAEQTFLLALSVARKLRPADKFVRDNPSPVDPGHKEHQQLLGFELKGKTLGVIGLGSIGCRVAEIGEAFGMRVIAYNRSPKNVGCVEKQVALEELLQESDLISLNLSLNKDTEHLISEKEFSLMKKDAIFINTARGQLVNTNDLYHALKENKIAGAGLDVLEDWTKNDPLFSLDNVVITPHIAFFSKESLQNLAEILVKNVESFVNGTPENIVN